MDLYLVDERKQDELLVVFQSAESGLITVAIEQQVSGESRPIFAELMINLVRNTSISWYRNRNKGYALDHLPPHRSTSQCC